MDPAYTRWYAEQMKATTPHVVAGFQAQASGDLRPLLKDVQTPVLIIAAAALREEVLGDFRGAADVFPNGRAVVFPACPASSNTSSPCPAPGFGWTSPAALHNAAGLWQTAPGRSLVTWRAERRHGGEEERTLTRAGAPYDRVPGSPAFPRRVAVDAPADEPPVPSAPVHRAVQRPVLPAQSPLPVVAVGSCVPSLSLRGACAVAISLLERRPLPRRDCHAALAMTVGW